MNCTTVLQELLEKPCRLPEGVTNLDHADELQQHYLYYLLLQQPTVLPTINVKVTALQPTWQQLIQNKQDYWVFRDHPERLQHAPRVAAKLQELQDSADPVYVATQVVLPRPDKLAVAPLLIRVGDKSYMAGLLWSGIWTYIEPTDAPWKDVVAKALHVEESCDLLYAWLRLNCSGPISMHLQKYTSDQKDRIQTAFMCHVLMQLDQLGVKAGTASKDARKRIKKMR